MRAITRTPASTRATGLMRVQNSTHHLLQILFRDENVPALDEIPAFCTNLHLFQFSHYTPGFNNVFDKLFTLKANIFFLCLNNENTTSTLFVLYFLSTKSYRVLKSSVAYARI